MKLLRTADIDLRKTDLGRETAAVLPHMLKSLVLALSFEMMGSKGQLGL